MSLVPFNRKNSLALQGSFANMLDDFFSDNWWPTRNLLGDTFKIDVKEDDNGYVVMADLPGIEKDEITLEINDGRLTISIEHSQHSESKDENFIHQERRFASMNRAIYLHGASDEDVKASLSNGVLEIRVKKEPEGKSKKQIVIES